MNNNPKRLPKRLKYFQYEEDLDHKKIPIIWARVVENGNDEHDALLKTRYVKEETVMFLTITSGFSTRLIKLICERI